MVDKSIIPPSVATTVAQAAKSESTTPQPKFARMSSPDRAIGQPDESEPKGGKQAETKPVSTEHAESVQLDSTEGTTAAEATSTELLTQDSEDDDEDDLEADDEDYADSAFGGSENSDTTSLTSSISQGIIENGRRYQAKRAGDYWGPADEKQAAHVVYQLLEHKRRNPLFLSPISDKAQNILDIGTGSGIWAKEVADEFPSIVVQGIDLAPPPQDWVPPNCKLEVDDFLKPWDFSNKFDLVHFRDMYATCSDEQWRLTYKQAYNNIAPGGWIEQLEAGIKWFSDDGSMIPGGIMDSWYDTLAPAFAKMEKPIDTIDHCKSRIEAAGFINVHEKLYKVPLGDWVKDPVLKEAGRFCKTQMLEGMEGYVMFILTHFGAPTPWNPEEVQVLLAKIRQEINAPGLHAYCLKRRVWAQKPFDKVN